MSPSVLRLVGGSEEASLGYLQSAWLCQPEVGAATTMPWVARQNFVLSTNAGLSLGDQEKQQVQNEGVVRAWGWGASYRMSMETKGNSVS